MTEGVKVTVRIPKTLFEKISKIANEKGYTTVSELIREAIRLFIDNYEAKKKKK